MRSHAELLEASGYGSRPKDFDDLIRILDSEIRLITPTDPEGKEEADDSASQAQPGQKYYQLTHDYLVPSLRDWLTRKQKETRRGRAELLLADRAAVWNARPENRQLPSLLQWLQIRWLTQKKNWTPPQRKMMGKAGRYHAVRGLAARRAAGRGDVDGPGYSRTGRRAAEGNPCRRSGAAACSMPTRPKCRPSSREMADYRQWIDPLLHEANAKASRQLPAETARQPGPVAGGRHARSTTSTVGCSMPSRTKCR